MKRPWRLGGAWWVPWVLAALGACGADSSQPSSQCGPTRALVERVVDGDTVVLQDGQKVRYLLVDTPELSEGACFAQEAANFNASLVQGREVALSYDEVQCRDRYDRLLAYVTVDEREVNATLVRDGYACVGYLPPAGESRVEEFRVLESQAIQARRGLWGVCPEVPCGF